MSQHLYANNIVIMIYIYIYIYIFSHYPQSIKFDIHLIIQLVLLEFQSHLCNKQLSDYYLFYITDFKIYYPYV